MALYAKNGTHISRKSSQLCSELNALGKHGKKLLHNLLPKRTMANRHCGKGNCKVNEIEKQNAAFA